jgi:hypothetical protein
VQGPLTLGIAEDGAICGLIDANYLRIPIQGRALVVAVEGVASDEEIIPQPVAGPQIDEMHPVLGGVGEGVHRLTVAREQALGQFECRGGILLFFAGRGGGY